MALSGKARLQATSPLMGALIAALLLALAVALAAPGAHAQGQGSGTGTAAGQTAGASAQELETLAKTLRDDAAREVFLENLDALIAAKRGVDRQAERPGLADRVAGAVAGRMEALGARFGAVLGVIQRAPELAAWAETQLTVVSKRERLIGLLWRFVAIVGAGMAAQYAFRRVTAGTRRRLETVPPEEPLSARVARFVARTLLLYFNAFAYAAGAYGAYLLLPMRGPAGAVLLVGASAFFAAKLILATARVFLSPGVSRLRPGGMSDETAHYLYIWVRRMVRVFVYAFFLLEALRLVGLPEPAHESLLYLIGLALAGFLVVLVLQNRKPVAAAIRGPGRQSLGGGARVWLASVWHLVAIAYIAAAYLVWLFKVDGGFEFMMEASGWTLLILVGAHILVLGADRGLDRVLRIGAEMAERFPGLETRANRYMPVLRAIVRWGVYIAAALLALQAWGLDTLALLASPEGQELIKSTFIILLIVLAALAAWEMINLALGRYVRKLEAAGRDSARIRTLLPLLRTAIMAVLGLLAGLVVLSEIGVNIGPLLAGAGVLGLAIGFGSQKLVQDVITGLFILVEDTLAVGDVVRFDADHVGIVESFSIRTIRLRDLSGHVHILPFSEVKTVLNMTKEFAYYLSEVGVAYRENVDEVIAILREIVSEMRNDPDYGQYIPEELEVFGLDKFGDSAVVIKVRIKVRPPIQQWSVGREFNRRMKARFDADGIEIPFPHRTLYFGEDRSGHAPPARVATVDEASEPASAPTKKSD